MLRDGPANKRELRLVRLAGDLVVVGGGHGGLLLRHHGSARRPEGDPGPGPPRAGRQCLERGAALDPRARPRTWATTTAGRAKAASSTRCWSRTLYRNPEGNPLILDTLLLEKVVARTEHHAAAEHGGSDVERADAGHDPIRPRASVRRTRPSMRSTAPLFCDASGDGIVGFLAGAAFRMGAEASGEVRRKVRSAPGNGELLGHTHLFLLEGYRPAGAVRAAELTPLRTSPKIPRFRDFNAGDSGCRLWWIEWGGKLDTVHDTEAIKWELWKVVYGVWNHIKNSGRVPGGGDSDAGMGRHDSGQAGEPPVRGGLHAHPAGHHRAAPARRCGLLRRLGH